MRGQFVCRAHGGASPQAKKKGRERLAALVEPSIDALERALASGDWPATVRAAKDLLDRAGMSAPPHDSFPATAVFGMVRNIQQLFLDLVADAETRLAFSRGLRRLAGSDGVMAEPENLSPPPSGSPPEKVSAPARVSEPEFVVL